MARRKGVKPKVTLMNDIAKVQPIPRGRDNTDDLETAEQIVHARMSHIRFPGKGSFEPNTSMDAFNGKVVTAPPYSSD